MNYKHFLLMFAGLSSIVISGLGLARITAGRSELVLSLQASKESYKPGEVVTLAFQLKNQGTQVFSFGDKFGVDGGFLHVLASRDGKNYRRYSNSRWGRFDYGNEETTTLKPGESVSASTTVL